MTKTMTILFFTILTAPLAAASPTPCHFMTKVAKAPNGYAYNIGMAYASASLVVVGSASSYVEDKPQLVHITKVIKGKAGPEIKLEGIHPSGTDPWGTAIPLSNDFLMLLTGTTIYNWVDSGSGCQNSFEVHDNEVSIGKNKVKLDNLKQYLESNPTPIY